MSISRAPGYESLLISPELIAVWEFLGRQDDLAPVDVILCLGSFEKFVPVEAARLQKSGWSGLIATSGGIAHTDDLANSGWSRAEAVEFADIIRAQGVPDRAILVEDQSVNTAENFRFLKRMLSAAGLQFNTAMIVHKPYMSLRAYLTGRIEMPLVDLISRHEEISLQDYLNREDDPVRTINVIVGDLHRVINYPSRGFMAAVEVPARIRKAGEVLARRGFDKHLLKGASF
ncbi:MAG: YdcF family protein [Comamonas sp.]